MSTMPIFMSLAEAREAAKKQHNKAIQRIKVSLKVLSGAAVIPRSFKPSQLRGRVGKGPVRKKSNRDITRIGTGGQGSFKKGPKWRLCPPYPPATLRNLSRVSRKWGCMERNRRPYS